MNATSKVGGMQVAAGRLLRISITVALLFSSAITSQPTWMVDDDGCHKAVLSNSLVSNITLVQGVVFSLRNTAGADASSVSALSVYLDEVAITPSIGFDIFTMNGDGTNSIGTTLDGSGEWKRLYGGTVADTQIDDDGATFLGSFGRPLSLRAGEITSIYLRFAKSVLRVSQNSYSKNNADQWDENAKNLNDDSMQIGVGRAEIVWVVISPDQEEFDQFYTPSIVPCKVWTKEACPPIYAPTLSPSTTSSPTTTRIIETVTVVDNTVDLFFETRSVDLVFNGEACSVDKDVIYPLLADSLEEVSMSAYKEDPIGTTNMLSTSITFRTHEDASPDGDDCSVVRFYYDVQIQYAIAEDDGTPPIELILQPLSTDSGRIQFLSTVNIKAEGNPYFSTLSSVGPSIVTQDGMRTRSPTLTPTISASPTAAPTISANPTAQPSAYPTISHMPSSAPIIAPSSQPSFSPSSFPSSTPTTELNFIDVDFYFYISYPSSKEDQVTDNLLSNMTQAFQNRFSKSSTNLLSDFHNDPRVAFDFDETRVPTVQKVTGATDEDCLRGNAIAIEFNVCERYVVIMKFQHLRKRIKSGPLLTHYVRMNSDDIAKELKISYDGEKSVMKDLLLIMSNADGPPTDASDFCDGLKEHLKIGVPAFNITEVLCNIFDFTVYAGNRGLRNLQGSDLGELTVEYTVIAEYRAIDGNDPNMFGTLVEDSINADSGKKVMSSLEERGLLSGKDMTAVTREVVPAPAPRATLPQDETDGSQPGLGATGITIIIVCVFVVFVAGFLFYKAIQRIKVINEDPFYDYDVEGTMKPKAYPEAEVYQDTSASDDEPEVKILTDDQANTEVAVVDPVRQSQPMRSLSREGIDRQGSLAGLNVFESRLRQQADSERSSKHDQGPLRSDSNSSLDSFERRLRRKAGESFELDSSLDSFEERLRRKTESNSRLTRADSNSSLEGFERRLRDKSAGSSSKLRFADSNSSLECFEERLKRKNNEGNGRLRPSDSNSSLESFERRLRKKAGELSSKHTDSSSNLDSFEERLRRKTKSNAKDSSRDSFEERLRRKTETNSNRTRAGSNLDSFEDRLKRKASEGNDNFSARIQQKKVERSDSNSSLDAFQQRIAAKNAANRREDSATTSSFDSRLHQKLRGGNSSSKLGAEEIAMDSFQNRLAKKMSEGSIDSRSRDSSPMSSSFHDRLRQKLSSDRSLSRSASDRSLDQSATFEKRLQKKLIEENRSSAVKRDSFDKRLQNKLSSQGSSRHVLSKQSSSTFEERLQKKLRDESRQSATGSELSFEMRLQKKRDGNTSIGTEDRFKAVYERARSLSKTRLERKDSENSMGSFEKRLQRKLGDENRLSSAVEGNSLDRGSSRNIASNQPSSSFEERLQKNPSDESREERFKDVYQRARSLSKSRKAERSDYEKRLEKKDSEDDSNRGI